MTTASALPEAWASAIAQWRSAQSVREKRQATIDKQAKHLARFARTAEHPDPWQVTTEDLAAWLEGQAWAPATRTVYRSTLRAFYSWAREVGHIAIDPGLELSALNGARGTGVVRPVGSAGPLPISAPPSWERPLGQWMREARAQGRSEQTIITRLDHLRRAARALEPLGPWEVTFYDLVDWMAEQAWSIETRRSMRSTLRSFYSWALEEGHVTTSPAAKLPKVGVARPNPHPASEEAVHFAILSATPRERLMVRLAAEIGLRRTEVACVHSRDLIRTDNGWSLVVHGKGSKDRVVPVPDELAAELRELPDGWAFPSRAGDHLTPRYVGKLVGRLLPDGVTMHALRHRFATGTYRLNQDVFAVQELLGHASPETTRRYVAVSEDRLRGTVNALAARTTRAARPLQNTEQTTA